MTRIHFRNLEKSELAREAAIERFETVKERFPELRNSDLRVTLSMENSPLNPGPDMFSVKVHCKGGIYSDLILEKSAPNLYAALAEAVDYMLERLNRFSDKKRVKSRKNDRRFVALARKRREVFEEMKAGSLRLDSTRD